MNSITTRRDPHYRLRRIGRQKRGYALIGTLMLIALAGAAMVAASGRALNAALAARLAESDLQRRWAILTAQTTLLAQAETALNLTILATDSQSATRLEFNLNGQRIQICLADEQSKANLNVLITRGLAGEQALREVVYSGGAAPAMELRPSPPPPRAGKSPHRPFGSFAHIFPAISPAELMGDSSSPSPIDDITCFGSGLLNFRRATLQSLRAICSPHLDSGQIDRLVALRAESPKITLKESLDRLQLPRDRRQRVEVLLTDASTCHSIWISMKSRGRSWYHLAVHEDGTKRLATFTW